jgi:hypothetical protein
MIPYIFPGEQNGKCINFRNNKIYSKCQIPPPIPNDSCHYPFFLLKEMNVVEPRDVCTSNIPAKTCSYTIHNSPLSGNHFNDTRH